MPKSPRATPVAGSDRPPIAGAQPAGAVASDEIIDVTIRLREGQKTRAQGVYRAKTGASEKPLTREALAEQMGARPEDARVVEEFAAANGLTVLSVSLPQRTIQLRGPAGAMQEAFGVSLQRVSVKGHHFRQRTGTVRIPDSLSAIVTGVFGLDDRPQAKPHFRRWTDGAEAGGVAAPRAGTSKQGFTPPQLAQIYQYPKGDGKGQCIALIELGGGYKISDVNAYAASLGLPNPRVVAVSVDGAHNAPTGNPNGPDGEVALDVEIAAGIAPAAKIAVYFAPNTDRGFLDAISAAVHDTTNKPNVISISWGGPESTWTKQSMDAMTEIFREAAAIGVPVFVAAGDDGATDGTEDGKLTVDFPAASPAAIACGGTRLEAANGKRTRETVWNDLARDSGATGGGFSRIYQAPAWQKTVVSKGFKQHMRGVPDVSANADPETGYRVRVDGKAFVIGGTSAVAPLMAGLAALCNQKGGAAPRDLVARLYAKGGTPATKPAAVRTASASGTEQRSSRSGVTKVKVADFPAGKVAKSVTAPAIVFDVTEGATDGYSARQGWDACTGLGVPVGSRLLQDVWKKK